MKPVEVRWDVLTGEGCRCGVHAHRTFSDTFAVCSGVQCTPLQAELKSGHVSAGTVKASIIDCGNYQRHDESTRCLWDHHSGKSVS